MLMSMIIKTLPARNTWNEPAKKYSSVRIGKKKVLPSLSVLYVFNFQQVLILSLRLIPLILIGSDCVFFSLFIPIFTLHRTLPHLTHHTPPDLSITACTMIIMLSYTMLYAAACHCLSCSIYLSRWWWCCWPIACFVCLDAPFHLFFTCRGFLFLFLVV